MSFVDKRPSRIQGQVFFVVVGEVKQDGQRYSVRSEKQKLNLFLSGAAPDVAGRGSRTLSQPRPVPEKFVDGGGLPSAQEAEHCSLARTTFKKPLLFDVYSPRWAGS